MIEPAYIKILADDDGFVRVIVMIIVGVFWVIGAFISKAKKKEAEAKENRLRQQRAMENKKLADNDDGWQVIAPPPNRQQQPPDPKPRPVGARKPSIQQFVKKRAQQLVEDVHANLVQPKAVKHLQHVQSEPLPVLHADGELSSRHICADEEPPRRIAKPTPVSRKPKLKPQKVTPAEATKTSAGSAASARAVSGLARLANPKAARSAMIFHEIFSAPKALRDEENIWD